MNYRTTNVMIDYSEAEVRAVEETLRQRYREDVDVHLADCEVQSDSNAEELVERPALFWQAQGCNFIVIKMDNERFEGRYFHSPSEQFGSRQQVYKDVVNCMLALLRDQADKIREAPSVSTETTDANLI